MLQGKNFAGAALGLLLVLAGWSSARAADPAVEEGFKAIFNGKDLTGWGGKPEFWSVKDGNIVGQTTKENPTKGNTFLIWKDGTVDDFELRLSYRIKGGTRAFSTAARISATLSLVVTRRTSTRARRTRNQLRRARSGILSQRGNKTTIGPNGKPSATEKIGDSAALQAKLKNEDWNDYRLVAEGNHLRHFINGELFSETIDEQPEKAAKSGILALQLHAGPPMTVEFTNIRIKRLKLTAGVKKLVMVAGTQSHGPGDHEFNAGPGC